MTKYDVSLKFLILIVLLFMTVPAIAANKSLSHSASGNLFIKADYGDSSGNTCQVYPCRQSEIRSSDVTYHVALDGDDANPGTLSHPWRTIQKSADSATAGSTVYIHGGRYFEAISIRVSGTIGHPITWCNFDDVPVIIDGSQATTDILLSIRDQSHLKVKGLHLTGFIGNDRDGVRIEKGSSYIEFSGNKISQIHFNANSEAAVNENTNVRPFIVLGNDATRPCREIHILNNEIFSCRTGYSEGLAINGNVENFTVNYNQVHDISNIGIVFIGHEETSPDAAADQAHDGICAHNMVFNCQSPYATAAGIYVDGAREIVIENNRVHSCQWGIEIGCEHPGKSAAQITVRNNLLYNNLAAGVACGGYDYPDLSGTVTDCLISHNTCYHNDLDLDWNGELNFSHAESCEVVNNIFVAGGDNLLLFMDTPTNLGNSFDYNLWYGTTPGENFFVEINAAEYHSLAAYRSASGQGFNSLNQDPLLSDPEAPIYDFHLNENSMAIDQGDPAFVPSATETDLDGGARMVGGRADIGADENGNGGTCPHPSVKVGTLYFATVSEAYSKIASGETIYVKADDFIDSATEPLLFDRVDAPLLKLVGGCNCDFIPMSSETTISSKVTISAGSVVIEAIVIGYGL